MALLVLAPPRSLTEELRLPVGEGLVGELVRAFLSARPQDLTVPMGAALGPLSQVRNLTRVGRVAQRVGMPWMESALPGMHPERIVGEGLFPAGAAGRMTPNVVRVMTPMGAWDRLGVATPMGTAELPPHMVVRLIRALMQQPGAAARRRAQQMLPPP